MLILMIVTMMMMVAGVRIMMLILLINIAFALFLCVPLTQQLTGFSAPESGKA